MHVEIYVIKSQNRGSISGTTVRGCSAVPVPSRPAPSRAARSRVARPALASRRPAYLGDSDTLALVLAPLLLVVKECPRRPGERCQKSTLVFQHCLYIVNITTGFLRSNVPVVILSWNAKFESCRLQWEDSVRHVQ